MSRGEEDVNNEYTQYANSVFEQPWWLDIVAKDKWREAIVEENGKVIARLPYVIQGSKVFAPTYTQTLGIWMDSSLRQTTRGNNQFSKQKEVIHALLEQIPCKQIDIVLDCSQKYVLPFRWEGYSIEPTFSYRIDNIQNLTEISKSFSKSVKRDINRGNKELVISCGIQNIDEFISLQNYTFERQKRRNPVNNELTKSIIIAATNAGHGQLFVAKDSSGIPHAGCFVLFDDNVCYHLLSGQNTSFGNDCAMPILFQKEFEFAAQHSKAFDFEGSMVEGIEQVYRRYGGKQIINWHVSKSNLFNDVKSVIKPRVKRLLGYKI